MIKVEIKPVYKDMPSGGESPIPEYLEKRIMLFGFTVFYKKVVPIVSGNGSFELPNRA